MSDVEKIDDSVEEKSCLQVPKRLELATRIFREHGDLIYNTIRSNLPREADPDDIFQDFFLSLVSHPVPDTVQNIKAYLYQAIKNDIADAARRTQNYRTTIRKYVECQKDRMTSMRPNHVVAQSQEVRKLTQIIERKLPPREIEAITERFIHDHSIDEAAKRMHINKKTYSQYLWLGLKKIRIILRTSGATNFNNSRA
jgi:RNA polymerase sigma-70 factor (ECF subfamily)